MNQKRRPLSLVMKRFELLGVVGTLESGRTGEGRTESDVSFMGTRLYFVRVVLRDGGSLIVCADSDKKREKSAGQIKVMCAYAFYYSNKN